MWIKATCTNRQWTKILDYCIQIKMLPMFPQGHNSTALKMSIIFSPTVFQDDCWSRWTLPISPNHTGLSVPSIGQPGKTLHCHCLWLSSGDWTIAGLILLDTRDTQRMKQRPKDSKYLVRLFRCWAASSTYTYVVLRGTPNTRIPLIPCTSYLAAKSCYTLYGSLISRRKESRTAWYHNMKNFAIQLMYG
jgi:hypothetical protein